MNKMLHNKKRALIFTLTLPCLVLAALGMSGINRAEAADTNPEGQVQMQSTCFTFVTEMNIADLIKKSKNVLTHWVDFKNIYNNNSGKTEINKAPFETCISLSLGYIHDLSIWLGKRKNSIVTLDAFKYDWYSPETDRYDLSELRYSYTDDSTGEKVKKTLQELVDEDIYTATDLLLNTLKKYALEVYIHHLWGLFSNTCVADLECAENHLTDTIITYFQCSLSYEIEKREYHGALEKLAGEIDFPPLQLSKSMKLHLEPTAPEFLITIKQVNKYVQQQKNIFSADLNDYSLKYFNTAEGISQISEHKEFAGALLKKLNLEGIDIIGLCQCSRLLQMNIVQLRKLTTYIEADLPRSSSQHPANQAFYKVSQPSAPTCPTVPTYMPPPPVQNIWQLFETKKTPQEKRREHLQQAQKKKSQLTASTQKNKINSSYHTINDDELIKLIEGSPVKGSGKASQPKRENPKKNPKKKLKEWAVQQKKEPQVKKEEQEVIRQEDVSFPSVTFVNGKMIAVAPSRPLPVQSIPVKTFQAKAPAPAVKKVPQPQKNQLTVVKQILRPKVEQKITQRIDAATFPALLVVQKIAFPKVEVAVPEVAVPEVAVPEVAVPEVVIFGPVITQSMEQSQNSSERQDQSQSTLNPYALEFQPTSLINIMPQSFTPTYTGDMKYPSYYEGSFMPFYVQPMPVFDVPCQAEFLAIQRELAAQRELIEAQKIIIDIQNENKRLKKENKKLKQQ